MKIVFLLLVFINNIFALGGYDFLNIPMGIEGFGSISNNSYDGVFSNPALLNQQKNRTAGFIYNNWFTDINVGQLYYINRVDSSNVFGLSFMGIDYGDFNETTFDNPTGTGKTFTANDYEGNIIYAKNIFDINFGINFSYIYSKYYSSNSSAIKIDFGSYKTIKDKTWSLKIKNFGYVIDTYTKNSSGFFMPYKITVGWGNRLSRRRAVYELCINYDSYESLYYNINWLYKFNKYFWLSSGLNFDYNDLKNIFSSSDNFVRFDSKLLMISAYITYNKLSVVPQIYVNTSGFMPTFSTLINYNF